MVAKVSYTHFPNGYRIPNAVGMTQQQEADLEVVSLFGQFVSSSKVSNSWAFKRMVVEAAVRLLGPNPFSIFVDQQYNPLLCNDGYAFLEDTAQFIREGRRDFSIYTRSSLFRTDTGKRVGEPDSMALARKRLQPLERLFPSGQNLYSLWLSKPGGFEDLISTMYVLFGPKGPTAAL